MTVVPETVEECAQVAKEIRISLWHSCKQMGHEFMSCACGLCKAFRLQENVERELERFKRTT